VLVKFIVYLPASSELGRYVLKDTPSQGEIAKIKKELNIMNDKALKKLLLLYEKYVPNSKPDASSQICLLWSTKNPPDVLENTNQLEAIEEEFKIVINEVEAVEMYDMNLLEASRYIQQLVEM
jgi:hypothetical protein